jgi:cellulose synthase/poly-beta-1,6-N-acetylglucosamine synthase-like glycosyltransferase
MRIRNKVIGGFLLSGIAAMVVSRIPGRPVRPKDGTVPTNRKKTTPSPGGSGAGISIAVSDEPAPGVHPDGRAGERSRTVRELPARAGGPDDSIDLSEPVESSRFTPPSVAPTVLSRWQKVELFLGVVALAFGFTVAPVITIVALNGVLVAFYVASNSMKVFLISRALNDPCKVMVDATNDRIPDDDLPVYTVLLPVYREADLLIQLVDGIRALDYPEDRLDVKLLLEEDDLETRDAAADLDLPDCFDVSVVPAVGPTGKPRACNHGLARARGEYLVIYDAEDRPEADQLRKSVLAFRETPPQVVCLQAQLNYFNRTHNLLTRWFTAEYSAWFDQLLPGLQAMDVVIPLGGTSNHFITARLREIGGWNAFNVTEDADLGLRIFLRGWKTSVLGTTTYEEATSRFQNWIRQRSRWVKGYMQTYLYHMRRPFRLARQMGPKSFIAFQLFFGAGTLCLLLNPVFWALTIVWFAAHLHLIQTAFPAPVLYLATLGLFVGNAACVLSMVAGCFGRRNYEDVKYAFLVPVYWVMMSVAAWKALIQLFYKPTYWEKTEHGFCLYEEDDEAAATRNALSPVDVLSAS